MCNLSDMIEERGIRKGFERGQQILVFELFRDQVLPAQMAAQKLSLEEDVFLKAFDAWEQEQRETVLQ